MTKDTGAKGRGGQQKRNPSVLDNFRPLIVDVAVPLGAYYLLKDAFGASTFAALAWSSVVPAARTCGAWCASAAPTRWPGSSWPSTSSPCWPVTSPATHG